MPAIVLPEIIFFSGRKKDIRNSPIMCGADTLKTSKASIRFRRVGFLASDNDPTIPAIAKIYLILRSRPIRSPKSLVPHPQPVTSMRHHFHRFGFSSEENKSFWCLRLSFSPPKQMHPNCGLPCALSRVRRTKFATRDGTKDSPCNPEIIQAMDA